jgi:hypothetical protein
MSEQVTLEGTAENAKGGAVVVVADGRVVYLRGKTAWPDEVRRTQVTVIGTLTSTKLIPSPVRAPDGAISQGAEGDQWVLDQWTLKT